MRTCLLVLLLGPGIVHAQSLFAGEWVTDFGRLVMTAEGDEILGEYGDGSLEGYAEGFELEFTWREGKRRGTGKFDLGVDLHSFRGSWKGTGGSGVWRGWRADPEAAEQEAADFAGLWLSTFGTLVLTQEDGEVTGTYGADGYGRVEGTVRGRRLELRWHRLGRSGDAWLEQTRDGKRIFGLAGDEAWTGLRPEGFELDVDPAAGKIVKGYSYNGMLYHLRAPKRWKPGKFTDAIILLHGSNWTTAGMTWVTAQRGDIGDRFMLIGVQGERWAKWSDADDLRFNYSYVNWMGKSTFEGYPHTERESPYLVHQLVEELRIRHRLRRILVLGHSQGGFLAYLLHMHYPDAFDGVAPMACGLVMQAEPDVFEDGELRAAQRETPLVMVHGKRDAQWGERAGSYNRERFLASGFPMMLYLTPDVGHAYDFLPIERVVEILDVLSGDDVKALSAFANETAGQDWRAVGAALHRARQLGAEDAVVQPMKAMLNAGAVQMRPYLELIHAEEGGAWVDEFLDLRDRFEFAPGNEEVMEAYRKLQAEHDPPAQELIARARQHYRVEEVEEARRCYEEIVEKYFACSRIRLVRKWLEER